MGFSGMARFAEQLRDTRSRSGWTRRMAEPGALAAALGRVQICLEQEYTAPAATRPLYADFLDEAAEVIGEPGLCRAATLFRRSAAHWSAIAATARDRSDAAVLPELADAVDEARTIEQQAAQIMVDAAA